MKTIIKKGLAFLLSLSLLAGLAPVVSGEADEVQAATATDNTPSVTVFATKNKLMTEFTPDSDGNAANLGKLKFGRKGTEWYILGKDADVAGDNIAIFAAKPIADTMTFNPTGDITITDIGSGDARYSLKNTYSYEDGAASPETVGASHYGMSSLRAKLQEIAKSTDYFNKTEQDMMNVTTVTTKDVKNSDRCYTTTDKLYALHGNIYMQWQGIYLLVVPEKKVYAGSKNSITISISPHEINNIWLRAPYTANNALCVRFDSYPSCNVNPDYYCWWSKDDETYQAQPASNLKLSSVLFASAVKASSSSSPESGQIDESTTMTLRLDGGNKAIGTVKYDAGKGIIAAIKDTDATGTVSLVVQGKGTIGSTTKNWYYSKAIKENEHIKATDIKKALGLTEDISLSNCKIWLETTDASNGMTYAKMATAGNIYLPSMSMFATKDELMTEFTPDSDGNAANTGKIVFGKNSSGEAQQWYILGKDDDVSGDNTIIFAASPIATNQQFNPASGEIKIADITDDRKDLEVNYGIGCCILEDGNCISYPKRIYSNHYGKSKLRVKLQEIAKNSAFFNETEQGMMNATKVETKDGCNQDVLSGGNVYYYTTDKLYAVDGEYTTVNGLTTWTRLSASSNVKIPSSYCSGSESFWVRSPYTGPSSTDQGCYYDKSQSKVFHDNVNKSFTVRPASNVNLSSVLFASAAKASSSSVQSGKIDESSAMTLRLNGSGKAIGTVVFDGEKGTIVAKKDAGATGTVSLVVQGNDGTNDWYYSVPAEKTTVVTAAQIKTKLGITKDIVLDDCKIWLETTDTSTKMTYATMAARETVCKIDSVNITGMKPVAGTTLKSKASCTTKGISPANPAITYKNAGVTVTGTAEWNKTYSASVKLSTSNSGGTVNVFGNSVSVTIDGEALTGTVAPNTDGTLTVSRNFTTEKRKIKSVTAPKVPTDNAFTNYYTESSILTDGSNSELGTQATVTFTDSVTPNTGNVDVEWTLENTDGTPYDEAPGAENTFRWSIPTSALTNYNVDSSCPGYDSTTKTITGTVTVANKGAASVTITANDKSIDYTTATIDVSQYFSIDSNAGEATYSLLTGTEGGTGVGTLTLSTLTVTQAGTFKIKVVTAAKGNYAAGEKTITLTIVKKDLTIKAKDQSIVWGNAIDQTQYTLKNELATDDSIAEITLSASTTEPTDNGKITISGVKIVNTAGTDVTGNYNIIPEEGKLAITNTIPPDRITADKTGTEYTTVDTLNVDDITVTAFYPSGRSRNVTGYTTNADTIDMGTAGEKTLTVTYTENNKTVYSNITINVSPATPYIATPPSAAAIRYGQELSESALTGGAAQYSATDTTAIAGTFVWEEGSVRPSVADSNKTEYTVVFKPASEANYKSVEIPVKLTVNKAENAPDMPKSSMNVSYSNQIIGNVTLMGKWTWKEEDKKKSLKIGTPVTATAIYAGDDASKGNYETESVEITITRMACIHEGGTEVRDVIEATCTQKGYTGNTYCIVCESMIAQGKETEALNHDFATEFTVDKEATCTTTGSKSRHCSRCNEKTEVTEIEKIPHTYVNGVCSVCGVIWQDTINGITYRAITEEVDGKLVGKTVTVSGNNTVGIAVAVIGIDNTIAGKVTIPGETTGSGSNQTFVVTRIDSDVFAGAGTTEIEVPNTVTEVGTGAFGEVTNITFNGEKAPEGIENALSENATVNIPEGSKGNYEDVLHENTNIVEMHTHRFAEEWTYDEACHWKAATCGHEDVVQKLPHTFGEWIVTRESTEDVKGIMERSCACGYTETEELAQLPHMTHIKDEGTRVEPTCEKKGSVTYKCTKCGKVIEVVELAAKGHTWDTGKVTKKATETAKGVKTYTCRVCGKTKTEVIPKKQADATKPLKKGNVVVKINGVKSKVTGIAGNAFKDNKKVTKVIVGRNIRSIGKKAFSGCKKLKTIIIKSKKLTSKTVSRNAFKGVKKTTTIKVPKKKLKAYKKLFKNKGLSSKVKIKKY